MPKKPMCWVPQVSILRPGISKSPMDVLFIVTGAPSIAPYAMGGILLEQISDSARQNCFERARL
jgi:hypothetical protein